MTLTPGGDTVSCFIRSMAYIIGHGTDEALEQRKLKSVDSNRDFQMRGVHLIRQSWKFHHTSFGSVQRLNNDIFCVSVFLKFLFGKRNSTSLRGEIQISAILLQFIVEFLLSWKALWILQGIVCACKCFQCWIAILYMFKVSEWGVKRWRSILQSWERAETCNFALCYV